MPTSHTAATLFDPENHTRSDAHKRVYAIFEIIRTAVDFSAALLFLVGSILFFWPSTTTLAIWMFIVGSVFFALKPSVRLVRELRYLRLDDLDKLAG